VTEEVCEVVITAPDAEWLAAFTRRLVVERLAAAGHNVSPIRTIYRWKGEVYDKTESRVALHTRTSLVSQITQRTLAEHPFEVPCVVASPIIGGNPSYIQWILEETAS
jgi:periplasmic divalent cation tolerance protein